MHHEKIKAMPTEKYLEVLVDHRLHMSLPCDAITQKVNVLLGFINRSIRCEQDTGGDSIAPLFSALVRPHLGYCV